MLSLAGVWRSLAVVPSPRRARCPGTRSVYERLGFRRGDSRLGGVWKSALTWRNQELRRSLAQLDPRRAGVTPTVTVEAAAIAEKGRKRDNKIVTRVTRIHVNRWTGGHDKYRISALGSCLCLQAGTACASPPFVLAELQPRVELCNRMNKRKDSSLHRVHLVQIYDTGSLESTATIIVSGSCPSASLFVARRVQRRRTHVSRCDSQSGDRQRRRTTSRSALTTLVNRFR